MSVNRNETGRTILFCRVGCFSLYMDGVLVPIRPGSAYSSRLDPGFSTIPSYRMLYRAFDVTTFFANSTSANHAVGARLGMCKYGYLDGEHQGQPVRD